MEKKSKLSKICLIAVIILICIALTVFLIIFVNKRNNSSKNTPKKVTVSSFSVDKRTVEMNIGETQKIDCDSKEKAKYQSMDKNIADVDEKGNIKAIAEGTTLIKISVGEKSEYCGVIVGLKKNLIDIKSVKPTMLFKDLQLFHASEIIGFGYSKIDNSFYFSQKYANGAYGTLASDSMLTKVSYLNNLWQRTENMHLYENGYGYLSIDDSGSDTYLLSESNGAYFDEGTTISKFKWEKDKLLDESFGQTFKFNETEGAVSMQLDTNNDLALLRIEDGKDSHYQLYNYSDMCKNDSSFYIKKFKCESNQKPANGVDDSKGRYNATVRGFMLHNGYLYQLSGSSSIYITVFDLDGKLQYCHRVTNYPDITYRHPASLCYSNGKIYLAVTSGTSELYKANVMVFDGGFE